MIEVELHELVDGSEQVVARVKYDGDCVVISAGDDDWENAIAGYVTHSEPSGTIEDGETWVRSLPEAIAYTYFWAEIVREEEP